MRTWWICLATGCALVTAAHADFAPQSWRYSRILPGPNPSAPDSTVVGVVSLDPPALSHAKADLSDLRLIAADGREIPCIVAVGREKREIRRFTPRILNNSRLPGAYSIFTADLGIEGTEHNVVEIQTSSSNFTRWVEIKGSPDGGIWYLLQPRGFIFDHSIPESGVHSSGKTVNYPVSTYRFLQVIVHDDSREPLTITGATMAREITVPAREVIYDTRLTTDPAGDKTASVFMVDLGLTNLPHQKITIQSPTVNFNRSVRILGGDAPDSAGTWHTLADGAIYCYTNPKYKAQQVSVTYPESRYRYLKVLVYHYDDPPLVVKQIQVAGIERRVFFQLPSVAPVTLFYGNGQAQSPRYDFGALHPAIAMEPSAVFTLGAETVNPGYRPSPLIVWTAYKNRIALAAMIILVIFLGAVIFRVMREQMHTGKPK